MYGTKRLGEWLVQMGLITPQQLQEALEIQRTTGKRLGETLIELGYLTREDYYKAQAAQYDAPYEPLDDATIEQARALRHLIGVELASRHFVIPLRKQGNTLVVAMADPNNIEAIDLLRQTTGMNLEIHYAPPERILHAIAQIYGVQEEIFHTETATEELWEADIGDLSQIQETIHQPPIIRLVNTILFEAVEKGASDVHFEPMENRLQVRYRIDGVLYPVRTIPRSLQASVLARVKLMGEMDIADRRRPQDGRFTVRFGESKIDARVSSLPTVFGERIVVRLLDRSKSLMTLEQLGMPTEVQQNLTALAARPWGMILVTGPTGAGKSTTLYALLQHLRSDRRNILTCEDPVEYTLEGIGQSQVNERAGLTFANQLRAILRQDPDVVLVGEIRDTETAEIACRAAMTGHLVLATLHTNDATSAPARLMDMGIPPFLINSALTGVLAQRLVRRLCPHCKQSMTVETGAFCSRWGHQRLQVWEPRGCPECNQIGYRGRVGLYELFVVNDEARRLIAQHADSERLRAACAETLFPMEEDARQKVLAGITSLEEVLAQLPHPPGIQQPAA
ncbi:type IV pilus assembly protein PilB [Armatimonadetes bacterium DC]|nr:type IV pilus assembly protein PilB [Armatimonadetes bacterium DC]